jgi:hypothetical protein
MPKSRSGQTNGWAVAADIANLDPTGVKCDTWRQCLSIARSMYSSACCASATSRLHCHLSFLTIFASRLRANISNHGHGHGDHSGSNLRAHDSDWSTPFESPTRQNRSTGAACHSPHNTSIGTHHWLAQGRPKVLQEGQVSTARAIGSSHEPNYHT